MPGHDTSSLFHVTAAQPRSSIEEFLRRRAVSVIDGRFAAKHHANRGTVAKKVGRLTAAKKTTPVRRLTVNRKPLRTHGSLAQPTTSGNGLHTVTHYCVGISLNQTGLRTAAARPCGPQTCFCAV